jgi:anthranilate phosphoribosyltransferase
VLIHGVMRDAGRVSTREVLAALSIEPSMSINAVRARLSETRIAFMPIEVMAPELAATLALRTALGVRNSAHTLAKMLQPFAGPAVRIVSVTHPEYLTRMTTFFTHHDSDALLLRGAEGEAVAHPRREPSLIWAHDGTSETWAEPSQMRTPPELPADRDAHTTARWIEAVLAGSVPVPVAISHQIACCKRAVEFVRSRKGAA